MKRGLIILAIIVGTFTIIELIIPGHLTAFTTYLSTIGNLFTAKYGEPSLPTS
jgi:hypothetical protein